jgi:hypothetical protein
VLEFDGLSAARKALREFGVRHYPSIAAFRAKDGPWFNVREGGDAEGERVRHRSTAATCLEALADARSAEARKLLVETAPQFAERALAEKFDLWKSDGAAFVYCRVRTLPAIVQFGHEQARAQLEALKEHLAFIWENVQPEPPNQAIREAAKRPGKGDTELTSANAQQVLERNYPANAFHTCWALRTLAACETLLDEAYVKRHFGEKRTIALLWTQNALSAQVAMHAAKSEEADPNQLAWALNSQLVAETVLATGEHSRAALYEAALAAFFAQQLPSGRWPLGQPLFHYPTAGNAYCYTFETLAELLRLSLQETPRGRLIRELLKPHTESLLDAWEFARRTAQPLRAGGPAVGWSSGHHPHRSEPEGWATASVFSFLVRLQRLIGAYTREVAATELGVRPSRFTGAEAEDTLRRRGATWTGGRGWSAGEQISALFLHPIRATATGGDEIDPDRPLIEEMQARSAILFGPPGTGKTTLVEALAGALNWDFVEVHASRFLTEGMDQVPRRADSIFARLMELDRCVVLFDEIDELLRNRQDKDADPFGRFLTTSMLPKVATLWAQGRIVFFVATNDIAGADPAIRRSQRFDSAIFVAPPSFDVKYRRLQELAPGKDFSRLNQADVESALEAGETLGYFALLRYDQLDELAALIGASTVTREALEGPLGEMGARLGRSDWQAGDDQATGGVRTPLELFEEMRKDQTRDHRMIRLVHVDGAAQDPLPEGVAHWREEQADYLAIVGALERPPQEIRTERGSCKPDSILEYEP